MVNALKLVGKLSPEQLSRHENAGLFFERCLLHTDWQVSRRPAPMSTGHTQHRRAGCVHPRPPPTVLPCLQVRLSFDVEILGKESWTGALLAPHASLLLEAMGSQDSIAEDRREALRQGLVRALARLSEEHLRPHVASLCGLMEREKAETVQLELIKLPGAIIRSCSTTVGWLDAVRPDAVRHAMPYD